MCQDTFMDNFISVIEYARLKKIPHHRVLSWVRRGLFGKDAKEEVIARKRYVIQENAPEPILDSNMSLNARRHWNRKRKIKEVYSPK